MIRHAFRLVAALLVMHALLSIAPANLTAQDWGDARAKAAADAAIAQLRSPYCPGRMLENCTSSAAGALRDSIHVLAATEGLSTEQLVEWMLARHGEEYRGVPERRGAGLLAWIMPPLALVVAAAFVAFWLRSRRGAAATASAARPSAISEAERLELAEAMRSLENSGDGGR